MAQFTNLQKMALEAPELAGSSITKNGVTFTLVELFTNLLDTNGGIFELAMAQLFEMLTVEDRNQSLTLGEFSFTRRTGMTFDERRYYWERKYRATTFGEQGAAPTLPGGWSYSGPWPLVG